MRLKLGFLIVFSALIIGYLGNGGKFGVLFQPFEWLEIVGIAIGIFMISNPRNVQIQVLQNLHKIFKISPYTRQEYSELLIILFKFFKSASATAPLELEKHIDNYQHSILFKKMLILPNGQVLVQYLCDYYRVLIMGFEKTYELENMIDQYIAVKRTSIHRMTDAILKLGDAMPALGIIVAVLGVVTAMGAMGSEPAILGAKIASALIGTFIGVFLSYGIIMPIGMFLQQFCTEELIVFEIIKVALISHANGDAPVISIEFARQLLNDDFKPSFEDLEKKITIISK